MSCQLLWIIALLFVLLLFVGASNIPIKTYECICCKHIFNDNKKIIIDTYNFGDESITRDACPECKSDMIFEIEPEKETKGV
jgi:hypothetical protein